MADSDISDVSTHWTFAEYLFDKLMSDRWGKWYKLDKTFLRRFCERVEEEAEGFYRFDLVQELMEDREISLTQINDLEDKIEELTQAQVEQNFGDLSLVRV